MAKSAEAPLIFVVGARGVPDVEGGCEKNAEMLFPLVVGAGYRVTLVGLADNIKADEYKGVRLLKAPHSRLLKTDKLLCYIAAIFMAARLRPRIVHFQGLGSALFLWAYKLMGAKAVVRYGSADYIVGKWGLLGRLGFLMSEHQLAFRRRDYRGDARLWPSGSPTAASAAMSTSSPTPSTPWRKRRAPFNNPKRRRSPATIMC